MNKPKNNNPEFGSLWHNYNPLTVKVPISYTSCKSQIINQQRLFNIYLFWKENYACKELSQNYDQIWQYINTIIKLYQYKS